MRGDGWQVVWWGRKYFLGPTEKLLLSVPDFIQLFLFVPVVAQGNNSMSPRTHFFINQGT